MLYAYAYIVLLIGGFASYRGAPVPLVLVVATLLALPAITKGRDGRFLAAEIVLSSANALVFAVAAHALGRAVSLLLAG